MSGLAAVYCRLSEEDRNKQSAETESGSIRNQKSMLINYAKQQGWEIYDIYSDDDYTGADRNRPEFKRLLRDAQAGRFNIILCKTQSRFTRELELVEKYINGLFPIWGIRFIGLVDNADTDNRGNKKARQINGLVNEWYLEDMSENIKSVLTDKRKKGLHIGSSALYGYKKDPEHRGKLLVDEKAADTVKEIFRLYIAGMGKTAIARQLNERQIPSPADYKRLSGSDGKGLWKYYTVDSILKNEMYRGKMVQGRFGSQSYKTKRNRPRPRKDWYEVENTHEPIIDEEIWKKAAEIRKSRSREYKYGRPGLFTGKIYCAGCGALMSSGKQRSGKRYFQCRTRYFAEAACEGAYIREDCLQKAVLDELESIAGEYSDENRAEIRLPEKLSRELIERLIEKITVGKRNEDNIQKIEIRWRF